MSHRDTCAAGRFRALATTIRISTSIQSCIMCASTRSATVVLLASEKCLTTARPVWRLLVANEAKAMVLATLSSATHCVKSKQHCPAVWQPASDVASCSDCCPISFSSFGIVSLGTVSFYRFSSTNSCCTNAVSIDWALRYAAMGSKTRKGKQGVEDASWRPDLVISDAIVMTLWVFLSSLIGEVRCARGRFRRKPSMCVVLI
jgi:hypothetical protein